jgi:phage recombination protein Bet
MATTETAIQKAGAQPSLVKTLAERYGLEAGKFYGMVKTVIFPSRANFTPSDEMVMAFLSVCNEYDLNPLLKEIYPFVDSNGNLRVIVGIDGWIKTVQRHPKYDGHEFKDHLDTDQKLFAVTTKIFRTDRTRAIEMTEYMHECKRDTEPWKQWPSRMLHHKSFIQAARYAFGMNQFIDDDEADRLRALDIDVRPLEQPQRVSENRQIAGESNRTVASEPAAEPTASVVPRAKIPNDPIPASTEPAKDNPASEADIKRVWEVAFPKGLSKVDVNGMVKKQFSVDRVQNLTHSQIEKLIGDLQAL